MPKLLLLTVNTGDSTVWDTTAGFNGFDNRRILGAGQQWGGWGWRTSLYIDGIMGAPDADLVVLTDGGDVFFVGPEAELIDKFVRLNHSIVLGAELGCCTGRFQNGTAHTEAVHFFTSRTPVHIHRFLNGGFVMGRRDDVLQLLMNNRGYDDDQEGYIDQLMKNPALFILDETQQLCGNFTFDPDIWIFSDGRFINTLTGESPVVMHFPGGKANARHYQMFSSDMMQMIDQRRRTWRRMLVIILVIIIILMFTLHLINKRHHGKSPNVRGQPHRTP